MGEMRGMGISLVRHCWCIKYSMVAGNQRWTPEALHCCIARSKIYNLKIQHPLLLPLG